MDIGSTPDDLPNNSLLSLFQDFLMVSLHAFFVLGYCVYIIFRFAFFFSYLSLQDFFVKWCWFGDVPITFYFVSLFSVPRQSSYQPMVCLILFLSSSLVIWFLQELPGRFWKHLISIASVTVQNIEMGGEHIRLIFELSEIFQ